MTRQLLASLAIALPMAMASLAAANAAPQILGVVASAQPTTLYCADGECTAQLTSICLTERRASPSTGTPYLAYNPQVIKITGYRPDGAKISLDVADALRFSSARGHLAVWVSLPEAVLQQYALASVSITIEDGLSLVPEPRPGDPNPLTQADIALATGPLRTAATQIVDQAGAPVLAAQLTTLLINALPARGRATEAERAAVWDRTIASLGTIENSQGLALVSQAHAQCQTTTRVGYTSLRQCLGSVHDGFMGRLNKKYWDAVKTGS